MTKKQLAYIQLHIAVILFGFTAILGKLISLEELPLVFYRLIFTVASLFMLPRVWKGLKGIPKSGWLTLSGIGIIVTLHWISFYASVKYSNVTVCLSALSTASFFTSILEPIIRREKFKLYEALLGLLVIIGMALLFQFGGGYYLGIVLGLIAAFLAALFSTLNKSQVEKYPSLTITTIELGAGMIFLGLALFPISSMQPDLQLIPVEQDWLWLIILALLCTTVAYVLTLNALKELTAFTANLAINLEPIYGILLAIPFFSENQDMDPNFYYGTAVILIAVILHPIIIRIRKKRGLTH